ncbi:MAG: D-alanyl-D-alanine-carboxypeptidase/endopeptidase AmpH [Terracidiphilus sp.]|nr:D-alanyl-D-alanine-carboxypeptidase/endopeptidase AmpH [Terracidiphilus sp.]
MLSGLKTQQENHASIDPGEGGAPEIATLMNCPAANPLRDVCSAKRRAAARVILPAVLLLASTVSLGAQQALSLADADLRGAAIFQQSAVTGMVLVVVRNGQAMVRGYGETFPGSGVKPGANSLIRLCSISKILTTDILTRLAAEGQVGLDDPLQRYAPRGKVVPKGLGGQRITLRDLATHTSGLPREVGAYPPKTPHFTFPDQAFRWRWLPRQKLIRPPGTAALYSNVGFDLLGDALASASGKTYAQLLNERIVGPLGLRDTTLTPGSEQCSRLLRGTRDEGACTATLASGASGGVYSTAADMTRVLKYLLHVPGLPAQPGAALAVYLKPEQLKSMQGLNHAGDPTGIGLGWIQLGDPNSPSVLMEKTGGGAGFSSYIALSPKRQSGVFLAVTDGEEASQIDFYHEANNLLAALANVPPLPPKLHATHAVSNRRARPRPKNPPATR